MEGRHPLVSICQVESNLPGEDRYCIRVTEDIYTYGVYDGHGGYLAADMASATLQDLIISGISSLSLDERNNTKIAATIDAAFHICDKRIIEEALRLHLSSKEINIQQLSSSKACAGGIASKNPSKPKNENDVTAFLGNQQCVPKVMGRAGSCAAVVIITGGMLFVAHVGDCRVVLIKDEPGNNHERTSIGGYIEEMLFDNEGNRKKQRVNSIDGDSSSFKRYDSLLDNLQSEVGSGRTLRRREVNPNDFGSLYRGFIVEGVTLDHSCDVQSEADAVRYLTSDPNPIRSSDSDRKALGSRAPLRVAGSLAVTRAFGDSYLKIAPLSTPLYVDCLPYISCKPSIHYRAMVPTDRSLIIASDGLWNFMKARDCAKIIGNYLIDKDKIDSLNSNQNINGDSPVKGILSSEFLNRKGFGSRQNRRSKGINHDEIVLEENTDDSVETTSEMKCSSVKAGRDKMMMKSNSPSRTSPRKLSNTVTGICANDAYQYGALKGDQRKNSRKKKPMCAKVVWSNKNIENLNYLFTLDSHIPSKSLNYFTGFLPLVTATATVAIEISTPSEVSGIYKPGVKNFERCENGKKSHHDVSRCTIVQKVEHSRGKSESSKSTDSPVSVDNDLKSISLDGHNNRISEVPNTLMDPDFLSSVDGKDVDDAISRIESTIKTNRTQRRKKCNENGPTTPGSSAKSTTQCSLDLPTERDVDCFSMVKVTYNNGRQNNGAFVSHKIVEETVPSSDSFGKILQIQAKACAGEEVSTSTQGQDRPPVKTLGYFRREGCSRGFDPGFFSRKNKELCDRRSSSCVTDEQSDDQEATNLTSEFSFDFCREEEGGKEPAHAHMNIMIDEGPALTLMDKCLDMAAMNSRLLSTGAELRNVPQGPMRRGVVDDITILVLTFQPHLSSAHPT